MTTGGLAHRSGIEVSALKEDVNRLLGSTRLQAAKDAGNTHRFLGIAYHEVVLREFALYPIECHEGSTLGHGLHHYLATLYLVGIEAVEGLAIGMEDIVGDVHDVVDGTEADGSQSVLQPFGTLLYSNTLDTHAGIARTSSFAHHLDGDGQFVVVHSKRLH